MPEHTAAYTGPARLRLGSDEHKQAFCRMLLDTHDPYRPAVIAWPELDAEAFARLTSLPIWDLAVQAEGHAHRNVQAYADEVNDPLLKEAVTMDAGEELRHKEVLSHMVRSYGIRLEPEPDYGHVRDGEYAFLHTGYGECFDSFFAFGLFELARRSGFFPPALVETFEPVIQEECRHILFFVNWLVWRRRSLPPWRRPLFLARCVAALLGEVRRRVGMARDAAGGQNFTVSAQRSVAGGELRARDVLDLCLAENERRMARLDPRLPRPRLVPVLVRLVRPFLGRPSPA